jgi:hypothetical protein
MQTLSRLTKTVSVAATLCIPLFVFGITQDPVILI